MDSMSFFMAIHHYTINLGSPIVPCNIMLKRSKKFYENWIAKEINMARITNKVLKVWTCNNKINATQWNVCYVMDIIMSIRWKFNIEHFHDKLKPKMNCWMPCCNWKLFSSCLQIENLYCETKHEKTTNYKQFLPIYFQCYVPYYFEFLD
jgi:hypothetical protein